MRYAATNCHLFTSWCVHIPNDYKNILFPYRTTTRAAITHKATAKTTYLSISCARDADKGVIVTNVIEKLAWVICANSRLPVLEYAQVMRTLMAVTLAIKVRKKST